MLKMCFRNSVKEKHPSVNTFSKCWNVTTAQIILKDKDDSDALCPGDSSPKQKLLPVSRYEWQVFKNMIFQINTTTRFQSVRFYSVP